MLPQRGHAIIRQPKGAEGFFIHWPFHFSKYLKVMVRISDGFDKQPLLIWPGFLFVGQPYPEDVLIFKKRLLCRGHQDKTQLCIQLCTKFKGLISSGQHLGPYFRESSEPEGSILWRIRKNQRFLIKYILHTDWYNLKCFNDRSTDGLLSNAATKSWADGDNIFLSKWIRM